MHIILKKMVLDIRQRGDSAIDRLGDAVAEGERLARFVACGKGDILEFAEGVGDLLPTPQ